LLESHRQHPRQKESGGGQDGFGFSAHGGMKQWVGVVPG
jgi:hypothetical protein